MHRPNQMSSAEAAENQRVLLRQIDDASNTLVQLPINIAKRNPIKFGFWILGLMLGFIVNGIEVTAEQSLQMDTAMNKIPYNEIKSAYDYLAVSRTNYERSRGWFWTCNTSQCISNKAIMDEDLREFSKLKNIERELMRDAKQSVGLMSEHGISDTRNLFWQKFDNGKAYASRATKWDILFAGISAIGRDEKIGSFLMRIAMNFLVNITMGIIGAVIAFWWSLWSLIQEYRAGIVTGLFYFCGAGLAAGSFAVLWIVGIYSAAAGTIFVGAKVLATNVRIEDSNDRRNRGHLRSD